MCSSSRCLSPSTTLAQQPRRVAPQASHTPAEPAGQAPPRSWRRLPAAAQRCTCPPWPPRRRLQRPWLRLRLESTAALAAATAMRQSPLSSSPPMPCCRRTSRCLAMASRAWTCSMPRLPAGRRCTCPATSASLAASWTALARMQVGFRGHTRPVCAEQLVGLVPASDRKRSSLGHKPVAGCQPHVPHVRSPGLAS